MYLSGIFNILESFLFGNSTANIWDLIFEIRTSVIKLYKTIEEVLKVTKNMNSDGMVNIYMDLFESRCMKI
jgi:hypothetical protein